MSLREPNKTVGGTSNLNLLLFYQLPYSAEAEIAAVSFLCKKIQFDSYSLIAEIITQGGLGL